ncbi:hypothetical protein BO71DRAFT_278428, partial [Aspergillus ellipticus CBS 707.79]
LIFHPNRINANIGDQVTFNFCSLNHTLTQSTLERPCSSVSKFDTGFNQYNPDNVKHLALTMTVNTLDPQWFFCDQSQPISHCHEGMVFALNPGNEMD